MVTRASARADFEEFVAVRSGRLWRTACLLTCDTRVGERLLTAALARAWSRWERLEVPPEQFVRAHLVEVSTRWWVPRPRRVAGDDTWARWTRLGRRARAAVVLRLVDGVDEQEAASALCCSERSVGRLLDAGLAHLGSKDPVTDTVEVPTVPSTPPAAAARRTADRTTGRTTVRAPAPTAEPPAAGPTTPVPPLPPLPDTPDGPADLRRRLIGVDERTDALRRHRRVRNLLGTSLAVLAVLVAVSVVPTLAPDGATPLPVQPTPTVPSDRPADPAPRPPRLLDRQLPAVVVTRQEEFVYFTCEASPRGVPVFRATVAPSREPQSVAWVSPRGQHGRVVVSVDGSVITRSPTGMLVTGLVLAAFRPHVVVLRATRPGPDVRLGLAVYRWPRP